MKTVLTCALGLAVWTASVTADQTFGGYSVAATVQTGELTQTGEFPGHVTGGSITGPVVGSHLFGFTRDGYGYSELDWNFFHLVPIAAYQTSGKAPDEVYYNFTSDSFAFLFPKTQLGGGIALTDNLGVGGGMYFGESFGGATAVAGGTVSSTRGSGFYSEDLGLQADAMFHPGDDQFGLLLNSRITAGYSYYNNQEDFGKGTFWTARLLAGVQVGKSLFPFASYTLEHHDLPYIFGKRIVADSTLIRAGLDFQL